MLCCTVALQFMMITFDQYLVIIMLFKHSTIYFHYDWPVVCDYHDGCTTIYSLIRLF